MSAARRNTPLALRRKRQHIQAVAASRHRDHLEAVRRTKAVIARGDESLRSMRTSVTDSAETIARSRDRLTTSNRTISPLNR